MPINKDKLETRSRVSAHRPKFIRAESWRYDRLRTTWRKPKGVDNHQRKQISRGRPGLVKIGYGSPRESRGLHPSGYTDNLIYNVVGLNSLDPKSDGVRIGHSVGTKKRLAIVARSSELGLKVFNARVNKVGSKS